MEMGLKGKVALVTAASKGLGRASAIGLAREGAHLAICSRDAASVEAAAAAIREETGARVLAMAVDVTSKADVERFVQAAASEYGRIDILVSNTGGPPPGTFMQFDDAAWQGAFDSLLMPAVRLTRLCIPHMEKAGGGRIIYITSGAVKQPIAGLILSNALRAAVTGMAKTLAAEVARMGINVATVAPGRIDTDRVQFLDRSISERTGKSRDEVKAGFAAGIPLGRYGEPREFGDVVVFLASERASYITGVTLQVDGGQIQGLF